MQQQTKLMGLQKCNIIQSNSGTTYNLTNRKYTLFHFFSKKLSLLPESRQIEQPYMQLVLDVYPSHEMKTTLS